jgi:hypothetical protein
MWNYRLIKVHSDSDKDWLLLEEVYYKKDKVPFVRTNGLTIEGTSKEEIIKELKTIIDDIERQDILIDKEQEWGIGPLHKE